MNRLHNISNKKYEYEQYHDYVFKNTIQKRANGVLKFLEIPYKIHNVILSEIASEGPKLHRLDFAGECIKDGEIFCIIFECQSRLPTEEDVKRFFQYVSSLRILKNHKVKLYILCTEKAPYKTKEFVLDDGCIYTMQVISLKDIDGEETLKNIENKIVHKNMINDEDIAALQLIAYTHYEGSVLELLTRASKLVGRLDIDDNEKEAIFYILDVLSVNMLNDNEKEELLEETKMLNPRYKYQQEEGKKEGIKEGIKEGRKEGIKEGKIEVARKLLNEGMPLEKLIKITGLTKSDILHGK